MTVKINEIGSLIRYHRKKAGLSQSALADIAGIGKATVFDIEKGKETIKLISLMKVLDALNISIEFKSPIIDQDAAR